MLKKHLQNMFYLFSGDILSRVAGFLATVYLARVLGKANFGLIHLGMALLSYAMLVAHFGLPTLGTRHIAAKDKNPGEFAGQIFTTRFLLSITAFIIAFIIIPLTAPSELALEIIIIYMFFLFPSTLLPDWYFQGEQQMGAIAVGNALGMFSYLIFILIWVQQPADTLLTAWGWFIGGVVHMIFLWVLFKRADFPLSFRFRNFQPLALLKKGFPLGLVSSISQLVIQFPIIYLGWTATADEVGVFSAALRLTLLLMIFDRMFYNVFFPAISHSAQQQPEQLTAIVQRSTKIVVAVTLSISMLAIVSAEVLVTVIFSDLYVSAVPYFQIMTVYFVLSMINSVVGYTLIGLKADRIFTAAFVGGLLVLLLTIYPLKEFLDIPGVILAMVLYQLTAMLIMAWQVRQRLQPPLFRYIIPPMLLVFFAFLPLLLYWQLHWGINCLLVIFLAIPLTIWFSGVRKAEFDYIRSAFR